LWELLRGLNAAQQTRRMKEFYASLLPKGALVFDIGANVGTMTQVFASLGARVVAVEPNSDCARHIERITPRQTVEVLHSAVGATDGLAKLKVSDRKDKMSSLSSEWCEAVSRQNPEYAGMWKRELTVPTTTLDLLIARYGMPFYIKIDVEGYEAEVLCGLSSLPPLLSFEFNKVFLEPVLKALDKPIFDGASFNLTLVDPVKFELSDWIGRDELKTLLGERIDLGLGDIFVRNCSSPADSSPAT
jgi:FkbM family methyltransferase